MSCIFFQPDMYSPALHDAVYLYALALSSNGGDPANVNGTMIKHSVENYHFKGQLPEIYYANKYYEKCIYKSMYNL